MCNSNSESNIESFSNILKDLDPNFQFNSDLNLTPRRFVKNLTERFENHNVDSSYFKSILCIQFPSEYSGIIKLENLKVFSICPHHLESIIYNIDFGYIPDGKKVVGLSKIVEFLKELANQPILQENYTKLIIKYFDDNVKNNGCIVKVTGIHNCIITRGVLANSECGCKTCLYSGKFKDDIELRREFGI